MMIKTAFVLTVISILVACAPMKAGDTSPHETPGVNYKEDSDTSRTIKISGKTYDKYTLWGCRGYSSDTGIVIELVVVDMSIADYLLNFADEFVSAVKQSKRKDLDNLSKKMEKDLSKMKKNKGKVKKELRDHKLGFILFDNRKNSTMSFYKRAGINHRWDWENGSYAFLIEPDGTGLYYDFTTVKSGTKKASDVFKCREIYD